MVVEGEFIAGDKTVLITGGCKGIGFETAKRIARSGSQLILTTRSQDLIQDGDVAQQEFLRHFPSPTRISIFQLDLTSLASVRSFTQKIQENFMNIHCIICNAGISSSNGGVTTEGYEVHFGVHCIGHFLLIRSLTNRLLSCQDTRVILVSSMLLLRGQVNLDVEGTVQSPGSKTRVPQEYCDSKLCMALLGREFQRRFVNISFITVSPGWCRTGLGREEEGGSQWFTTVLAAIPLLLFSRSAESGADSIVYCALAPNVTSLRGEFIRDRKSVQSVKQLLNQHETEAGEVWRYCEAAVDRFNQANDTNN